MTIDEINLCLFKNKEKKVSYVNKHKEEFKYVNGRILLIKKDNVKTNLETDLSPILPLPKDLLIHKDLLNWVIWINKNIFLKVDTNEVARERLLIRIGTNMLDKIKLSDVHKEHLLLNLYIYEKQIRKEYNNLLFNPLLFPF